jgi:GNAT superfamily N-acetyltransferase
VSTGPPVTAAGAACRLRPSPTAIAVRLEGLRATDGPGLDALLAQLPEPPWDAEVTSDDPLVGLLIERGFTRYANGAIYARPAQGMSRAFPVGGVELMSYVSAMADDFAAAEARAMDGLATFTELGSPSPYQWGEGDGAFVVAVRGKEILGFAHADMPDGWIDWMGVVPEARRAGIGTLLVNALAETVRNQRATHLVAFAEDGTQGPAFLRALGFARKGARTLLIRRA